MNDENLRPYKPGQSGNPKGKPKGARSLTKTLRDYLERSIKLKVDPITGEKDRMVTIREMMILSLFKKATQGSEKAIEMIFDRADGKIPFELKGDKDNSAANVSIMMNFFKMVETLGKDDRIRDRLAQAIESPEAVQIRESLQDKNEESETTEP